MECEFTLLSTLLAPLSFSLLCPCLFPRSLLHGLPEVEILHRPRVVHHSLACAIVLSEIMPRYYQQFRLLFSEDNDRDRGLPDSRLLEDACRRRWLTWSLVRSLVSHFCYSMCRYFNNSHSETPFGSGK